MKICPKCETPHEKKGTFCSRKCANGRVHSEETKKKIAAGNKGKPSKVKGLKIVYDPKVNEKRCLSISKTRSEKAMKRFNAGLVVSRDALRRFLTGLHGHSCAVCSINEWNSRPLTLQVDHIDGNAGNNFPSNLRLICPNCHSQTDSFTGRNKGFGRKARGIKR